MLTEQRGGLPKIVNGTADNTGGFFPVAVQPVKHMTFRNSGANDLIVSFTESEFNDGVGYTVPTGNDHANPLQIPVEFFTVSQTDKTKRNGIWVKCAVAGSSSFELIAIVRRG